MESTQDRERHGFHVHHLHAKNSRKIWYANVRFLFAHFEITQSYVLIPEPEPTRETTALEVNLNDLLACGDYVVGVATAGRLPTQRVKFIREDNDMVRFPLKVETSINVTDNTLAIKWTRECHYPSLYRLRMADLITNDRHAVDVSLNLAKISWEYNYVIAKGAIYNLSISSNDGKSIVYSKIINATPLPTPNRLTVNNNRLDDIEFNWEPIRFDESRWVIF